MVLISAASKLISAGNAADTGADAWCYLLVRELLPVTDGWFVVWMGRGW